MTQNSRAKQKRGILLTVVSIVAVMSLFIAGFVHKVTSPRILSAEELRANQAIVFQKPRIIKPFELIDHNGKPFTLENLNGKWSLIYYGFTHCPDICPNTLAKLNQVMSSLDADIAENTQVILVTLDPARDTTEKLAQYVPYFNSEFIGVTGEFLEILKFSRNVNVAFSKVQLENDYTIDHTSHLVLVNPKGHYHGFFKPPFELARLKVTYQSIVSQF